MNLDKIQSVYEEFQKNGWSNHEHADPYQSILLFFKWEYWSDSHVCKGFDIRFTEDALIEELDVELHHFFELVGAYTHTGDIMGVLERWLSPGRELEKRY